MMRCRPTSCRLYSARCVHATYTTIIPRITRPIIYIRPLNTCMHCFSARNLQTSTPIYHFFFSSSFTSKRRSRYSPTALQLCTTELQLTFGIRQRRNHIVQSSVATCLVCLSGSIDVFMQINMRITFVFIRAACENFTSILFCISLTVSE